MRKMWIVAVLALGSFAFAQNTAKECRASGGTPSLDSAGGLTGCSWPQNSPESEATGHTVVPEHCHMEKDSSPQADPGDKVLICTCPECGTAEMDSHIDPPEPDVKLNHPHESTSTVKN